MAIVKKRRGKWVLDYRDQQGRRRWETVNGTRKDANDMLAIRIQEVGRGEYQSREEQKTFEELVEAYKSAHINVNLRETTRKDYEQRIDLHILPVFKEWKLRAITMEAVERFRADLLEKEKTRKGKRLLGQKMGRRTVNKCLILLGSMFRYAIRHRWMIYNPAAETKKLKEGTSHKEDLQEDNVLRPEEIRLLLEKMPEERWRLIVKTAVLTGLRQGEILGLQWTDIDWNASQVHVQRSFTAGKFYEPKTKYSRRKVDMPGVLISELKRWKLQCPTGELDLVFPNGAGKPENHGNLLRRGFYPALRRAGLRQIRFHDLRHTYASLLIANGEHPKYIQSQLGHSSIKITMDVYGHLMKEANTHAADKLASLALCDGSFSESGSKTVAEAKKKGVQNLPKRPNSLKLFGGLSQN